MATLKTPHGQPVYLSVNEEKLADVLDYKVEMESKNKFAKTIFEQSASKIIKTEEVYKIEFTRAVLATQKGKTIDFHSLHNFEFAICKPGQKTVYLCCQVKNFSEQLSVGKNLVQKAEIVSNKRVILKD